MPDLPLCPLGAGAAQCRKEGGPLNRDAGRSSAASLFLSQEAIGLGCPCSRSKGVPSMITECSNRFQLYKQKILTQRFARMNDMQCQAVFQVEGRCSS